MKEVGEAAAPDGNNSTLSITLIFLRDLIVLWIARPAVLCRVLGQIVAQPALSMGSGSLLLLSVLLRSPLAAARPPAQFCDSCRQT